jgi:DNA-binding NarL/FixJ family response regulator
VRGALLQGQPGFARDVVGLWLVELRAKATVEASVAGLTSRQSEILGLIGQGATDKEIAARLGIATATAQKHVANILRRLGVPNRAAAVAARRPLSAVTLKAPRDVDRRDDAMEPAS